MTDKIDTRSMSDGEIYAAVSRKVNPEEHAKIDAFLEQMLNEDDVPRMLDDWQGVVL